MVFENSLASIPFLNYYHLIHVLREKEIRILYYKTKSKVNLIN